MAFWRGHPAMPSHFPPHFPPHVKIALHALAARLFPICRSITGEGLRASLEILKEAYEDVNLGLESPAKSRGGAPDANLAGVNPAPSASPAHGAPSASFANPAGGLNPAGWYLAREENLTGEDFSPAHEASAARGANFNAQPAGGGGNL